ncbi:hypothetical protein CcaverHIS002_0510390 [Cutaneotrichosporon cavernicola]|uniref:Beach-domain-containing protein n=1 Tax=Cutaneotrichosporon cavernicola TaxID=279322 RepID=A0AA48QXJ7_9TREE|nr:uncharacterized protein CcaverHIS019_0510940 [Cutaneotrichosporon cavernicola]BEI85638.1 hypothetical protein CcaverHIS002_0510390 [Cutaneotrichosporon cavernicola]BEI93466.1 hypothetical protein CcaverHIS019_0510940 [Cutaneotrichosporon cavernicola]BEJ01245.1 hypothetical protein CcaverHIS631_0511020 [Cutaneotrichosporon cavernicola]BEJ09013.1 hypothetical protein CcaverHIS641_0511070 [Cutaneotrichosporon cavernicola]
MFKLLKDLTRPPEPLGGRSRSASLSTGVTAPAPTPAPAPPPPEPEVDEQETDVDARTVISLVDGLPDVHGTMAYVETFSHLLTLPSKPATRAAFRRHEGFARLFAALHGLGWARRPDAISQDEWTVFEVQRAEGLRLWFEALAWGMGDRAGERAFDALGGYMALLPLLRKLSSDDADTADAEVLGILLSHLLGNNYTLRSLFTGPKVDADAVLKDAHLRWAQGLPLLWAYIWGLEKGDLEREALYDGAREATATPAVWLTLCVIRALAADRTNLLLIRANLPALPEFLVTRIYGYEPERHFDVTFPPRDEWFQNVQAEPVAPAREWFAPSAEGRALYLSLLQRVVTGGMDTQITWRLFQLVRKAPPKPPRIEPDSIASSGAATPIARPASPGAEFVTPASTPGPDTPRSQKKRPTLKIKLSPPLHESLDTEVLDLVRRAMRSHNPHAFIFRSAPGVEDGSLDLSELDRPFPPAAKGFVFAAWVNISRLTEGITLLHLSQEGRKHPLLAVRVLENSQISITTTAWSDKDDEVEEVICGAADALIPHREWVHFCVGCRKGRAAGEARIFINGRRVGVMHVTYPIPRPGAKEGVRVSVGRAPPEPDSKPTLGHGEGNEWSLGRTLLLEEVVAEDIVLLMHHLGPRYAGNMQEAAGKFLTYEDATAININLHALAAGQKAALLPANSQLVRAISSGPAIPEDNIMLSLSAADVLPSQSGEEEGVLNGAVPHISRARDFTYARAHLVGSIFPYAMSDMDVVAGSAGGGVLVLKLVDLASTPDELRTTLGVLWDMLRYSWAASEEMERIRGYDLLAAILRPKMGALVDTQCAEGILAFLGIDINDPSSARVQCSAGYKALGLDLELWAHAQLPTLTLYLQHFQALLAESQYRRFNQLRTFQKSNVVRKLLYALRSGHYTHAAVPLAVNTLRLVLTSRWSAEDGIKPVFSYLVSALCQLPSSTYIVPTEPTSAQYPAALILTMLADVLKNAKRLTKLNKAISLHRLLVIFLQSNPTPFVVVPCTDILALCLSTPSHDSFQRHFEAEGGFVLLAKTLAPIWNAHIQDTVFGMLFGPTGTAGASLACPPVIASVLAALDALLHSASGGSGVADMASSVGSISSTISGLSITPIRQHPDDDSDSDSGTEIDDDGRLESLLTKLAQVYRQSSPLRRALTARRIESMLPAMVDFVTMTVSSSSAAVESQRAAALQWLQALVDLSKSPATIITQLKLLIEQLKASSSADTAARTPTSVAGSISRPAPPRRSSSNLSTSMRSNSSVTSISSPLRRAPSGEGGGPLARLRARNPTRMPLRRTLTGESILQEERDKNAAWRMIILSTDARKHATETLERKEHWHRLNQVEWPGLVAALRAENGVWAEDDRPATWRLDGSEGPLRMRIRLERTDAVDAPGRQKIRANLRDAIPGTDELSSAVSRINAAPWEDPFSLAMGESMAEEQPAGTPTKPTAPADPSQAGDDESDDDAYHEVEDESTNKMRLVAKALQAGDVVESAHNIVRIVGVDALPGLLILGRKNLYLIDGLVQTPEGQVIEAEHAPRDVLSIPSGTLADFDPSDQRSHRWTYSDIVETNKRAFLFRDVALELYFADKQNFLVIFRDKRERQTVVHKMGIKSGTAPRVLNSFVLDTLSRALVDTREVQLESMTRKWQSREISNFAYLQLLNQHANRTPNDVTQYPVFPWVLADYTSQILDLSKKASYRDLSRPMGALTPARREEALERYQVMEGVGEKPFHYGTHYSSSMIVCGYMIRLSPFTEIFLALQGGTFDLADRLFSSVPRAWDSASATNRGDVRELIPEFFYAPSFLTNLNHHDFGRKQVSGDVVNDVALPPWALNDPLLFVHINRETLESDYVSRHLPEWIDLTFGHKQGDAASFNCFHPLSYRGAVDLDRMKDDAERASSTAIIHNFGQTPLQIFRTPHPHRFLGGRTTLPIGQRFGVAEQWQLLLRSVMPIMDVASRVHHILENDRGDGRPRVEQKHRLAVPGYAGLSVQFGFADQSIRIYHAEMGQRLVYIVEGIDVTHAAFAAPTLLVTVSSLGVLTAWRLAVKGGGLRRGDAGLTREATLRGANRTVTSLAVSTAWSFIVTGCADGTALVWDSNRLRYTRALKTPRTDPIEHIGINEANGHICLASARYLYMFSLNGHPMAATSADGGRFPEIRFDDAPPEVRTFTGGIAFLHREFLASGDLLVIGVNGTLVLYRCIPGVRRFEDQDVEPWRLVRQGVLFRSDEHGHGDVTAVMFIGETLYAAFEPTPPGRKHAVYQWSLPDAGGSLVAQRRVPDSTTVCMSPSCGRHFGLLDPRRWCTGCGGAFCGAHALHVEFFENRYCDVCRGRLGEASELGLMGRSRMGSRAGSLDPSRVQSAAGSRRTSATGPRPSVSGPTASSVCSSLSFSYGVMAEQLAFVWGWWQ